MKGVMYHYVRPDDPQLPHFRHLHLEDFERQLDYFAEYYGFLSKSDFLDCFEKGQPQKGIILTFDDGLRDHFEYVLPCLRKRNLWGIFYVPTGVYHTGKLLDVHRIHLLLGRHGGRKVFDVLASIISDEMLSHAHVVEFRTLTYALQNNDDHTNFVKRTLNYYISYEHRESAIDWLMQTLLPDEKALADRFYLSGEEIRQMQAAGMIVGSHTVNHPVMSKLAKEEQAIEIGESFRFLETITGGLTLKTFSHPYGGFYSFTEETEGLLDENRFIRQLSG